MAPIAYPPAMNRSLYLASQSPRRMELLRQIGITPILLPVRNTPPRVDVDETPQPGESPEHYVLRLAEGKAAAGLNAMQTRHLTPRPILAADTTVTLDSVLFGKPADEAAARAMLRAYSGRTHRVLTWVALAWQGRLETRLSVSEVRFRTLDDADISAYLATGEAWGKAGGYAIQGYAALFIAHLAGSYSGVMGLPLHETAELLREAAFDLF